MAFPYGSDDFGFCILNGMNIASNLTDMTDAGEAIMEESHTLGDSWVENSPVGVNKFEVGLNGFWDDTDNMSNEALGGSSGSVGGNIGSTAVLTWTPKPNTLGNPFKGGLVVQKNFTRITGRGALTKFSGTLVGTGVAEDGIILKPLGASTGSTGNSQATSYDGTSSSTKGGAGYFQISSLTMTAASTSFVAGVRHSVDDTTWVQLITFTASTVTGPLGERVATAASTTPVQRYLAANWQWASTVADSTNTATFFVGFVRNR